MPNLLFPTNSKLSATDDARLSRIEAALPAKVAGRVVFSNSSLAVPGAAAVQAASGQIAPTGIAATGSTFAFVVQGNFAFTANGTSITIYWNGSNGSVPLVIRRANLANFTIPAGTLTISGLTPGTRYGFLPFLCIAQPNNLSFVSGDAGQPQFALSPTLTPDALAMAQRTQRLTTNEPITVGPIYFTATAGASGMGEGSYTGN